MLLGNVYSSLLSLYGADSLWESYIEFDIYNFMKYL